MQSGQSRATVSKLNYLDKLEKHIENTLSDNWILRVEHAQDINPVRIQWQQWGDAQYCVKEANPLINSIQACRAKYPTHSVRLCAEKPSPQTRFIYPVCRPGTDTGSTQVLPGKWASQRSRIGAWLKPIETGVIAARTRLWRIITVTAMLLGSLLVFEEVIA